MVKKREGDPAGTRALRTNRGYHEPGDTICIPADEEREFRAIGSDPTTILVVFSPNPK